MSTTEGAGAGMGTGRGSAVGAGIGWEAQRPQTTRSAEAVAWAAWTAVGGRWEIFFFFKKVNLASNGLDRVHCTKFFL